MGIKNEELRKIFLHTEVSLMLLHMLQKFQKFSLLCNVLSFTISSETIAD